VFTLLVGYLLLCGHTPHHSTLLIVATRGNTEFSLHVLVQSTHLSHRIYIYIANIISGKALMNSDASSGEPCGRTDYEQKYAEGPTISLTWISHIDSRRSNIIRSWCRGLSLTLSTLGKCALNRIIMDVFLIGSLMRRIVPPLNRTHYRIRCTYKGNTTQNSGQTVDTAHKANKWGPLKVISHLWYQS